MEAPMNAFLRLFSKRATCNIVGMIHLMSNPGSPCYRHSVTDIIKEAEREAVMYREAGVDGVLVENMHDIPYIQGQDVGPEVVAVMTAACSRVRAVFTTGPVGVQILAGANQQALAVALAAGLDFVRTEGFVFGHVADEGLMNACAGPLLRYRRHIGADHIKVFTDIKKKHSAHAITSDIDVCETAKAAEFFLSDGLILTGSSTGTPADSRELHDVQASVHMPVLVGSGITQDNLHQYKSANALIVGSFFKQGGHWANQIDETRLRDFMDRSKNILGEVQGD